MTTKAHAKFDPMRMGISLAVVRENPNGSVVALWEDNPPRVATLPGERVEPTPGYSEWLSLQEDEARAIYEALADYFGHAGHDTRALRKDYDAERGRVDKLIAHLTGGIR